MGSQRKFKCSPSFVRYSDFHEFDIKRKNKRIGFRKSGATSNERAYNVTCGFVMWVILFVCFSFTKRREMLCEINEMRWRR